ncbi:34907_t:CDS:2, partial [Gigaspora margarita]
NSSYNENVYLNNSVLTLKATRNYRQIGGNKFDYLSGTIHAKELIEVNSSYPNYLICGDFIAPTIFGTWPAFWLTGTSWPPEVDILEFKGSTFNNFNIYINNTNPTNSDQIILLLLTTGTLIDLQMEGSSGSPGPFHDTFYYLRNVDIIRGNITNTELSR